MSVPKGKRSESVVQFIATAGEIHRELLMFCVKLPNRWTTLICGPLMGLSSHLYHHVVAANSTYHTNKHEAQIRVDNILLARNYLNSVTDHLSLSHEVLRRSDNYEEWMTDRVEKISQLLVYEGELLTGILAYYRKLYKNAPNGNIQFYSEFGELSDDEISLLRGTLMAYRNRFEPLEMYPIVDIENRKLSYSPDLLWANFYNSENNQSE